MDKIDVYLESAVAVLKTKTIGHMAALLAAESIIALAKAEYRKFAAVQQGLHPTSETLPAQEALSTPEHSATSQS